VKQLEYIPKVFKPFYNNLIAANNKRKATSTGPGDEDAASPLSRKINRT